MIKRLIVPDSGILDKVFGVDWNELDDVISGMDSQFDEHVLAQESVHNFDASGNAPAQSHGNERHSVVFVTQSGIDAHSALDTGVHGVGAGIVAKVSDVAIDSNLSVAAQDAISKKHTQNSDTDLDSTFEATFEKVANKGIVSGYAPLGADQKVPDNNSQVPSVHIGAVTGVHGVGASTVDSVANRDIAISGHASLPSAHHTAFIQADHDALPYPHHSNANDPTTDQKAALLGTYGTPNVSNKYTTDTDKRLARDLFNAMATGLLSGGVISPNGSDKFDISDGAGIVVNNYTDTLNPTRIFVSWSGKTAITVTNIATADVTYVAIDSSGNVVQSTSPFTGSQSRDYIVLGLLIHTSRVVIENVLNYQIVTYDTALQFSDFLDAFGIFNITGNVYSANGSNLNITKSAGSIFRQGSNYSADKKVPNIKETPLSAESLFYYTYHNSEGDWVADFPTTVVDPSQYDTLSGLLSVPSGYFTTQAVFYEGNISIIQYGQTIYATMGEAEQHLQDPFELALYSADWIFRSYLIVQEGTTELNNASKAKFVTAGKFGLATVVTGAGGGEVNTASNVGLEGVGTFLQKSGVDLQFRNIAPASDRIVITENPTDKTVEIDADPSKMGASYYSRLILMGA